MRKNSLKLVYGLAALIVLIGGLVAFLLLYRGWIRFGNKSWYWDHGDYVHDRWEEIEGVRYRFDGKGDLCEGWVKDKSGLSYFTGGLPAVGEKEIEGSLYYFNKKGIMQTGFVSVESSGSRVFYYGKDGKKKTGWVNTEEGKYYISEEGMLTGWQEIDGNRYCFAPDGIMRTGWVREEGNLYCLGPDGVMRTSEWIREDRATYYVKEDGRAASGKTDIDGKTYLFTKDCLLARNAWVGNSHADKHGVMETDTLVDGLAIDGKGNKIFDGAYGDGGNLFIPSVGVEVPLYKTEGDEHGQEITDRGYSAALLTSFAMPVIADHKNQGFERIKTCLPNKTKALILTRNQVEEYLCTARMVGSNVEDDILDDQGNSIDYSGADLCLYTCNEDWRHVTIVLFDKK